MVSTQYLTKLGELNDELEAENERLREAARDLLRALRFANTWRDEADKLEEIVGPVFAGENRKCV